MKDDNGQVVSVAPTPELTESEEREFAHGVIIGDSRGIRWKSERVFLLLIGKGHMPVLN